jgi:co-chaperonin GroES (HSP10)
MKLKPPGYRVIVRPDEVDGVTPGGIVLPPLTLQKEQNSMAFGTLIEKGPNVGHGVELIPVGARVMFAKYSGATIKVPRTDPEGAAVNASTEYRVINDEDVQLEIVLEPGDKGFVTMEDDE